MKKIVLITSFCNNQEKINTLKNTLNVLKNLDLDVMFFTSIHLPEEIDKHSDYVIISTENPIFDWPVKAYYQWTKRNIKNLNINMSCTYPDYGYAVLNQIKRMSELALSMDYNHFFIIDYDTNITEEVKNVLLDNKSNSFFPSKRGNTVWDIGLHLISLDRYHLNNFKNLITPESYLTEKGGDAFSWTHKAIKFIPAIIENVDPIEDLIYNFNDFDFFNYSTNDEYKLFIHKTHYDNIKLLFYGFEGVKNFKVVSNTFEKEFNLESWDYIELPFNTCSLLKINNTDYIENIKSIGQNILEINTV